LASGPSSSQRTTNSIVRPLEAAANSSGASSFSAATYQKSASCKPPEPVFAAAASQWATRIAPRQLPAPHSGVAREGSKPVTSVGSKIITSPSRWRWHTVPEHEEDQDEWEGIVTLDEVCSSVLQKIRADSPDDDFNVPPCRALF
jgi:hypothetical protein